MEVIDERRTRVSKRKRAPEQGALRQIVSCLHPSRYGTGLDYSEVTPLPVDRLQLMHTAIVGVEEVAAIRDRMVVRRADRATSPASATRSSPAAAMFAGFFAEFDAIFDLILDTGQPGRH